MKDLLTYAFSIHYCLQRLRKSVMSTVTSEVRENAFVGFEEACKSIKHHRCPRCRQVGIFMELKNTGMCDFCVNYKNSEFENVLPTWKDDNGCVRYDVPEELQRLSLAEKMLIQLAPPFIPLQHIKHGVFGLSGHVCSFEQDTPGFMKSLPRSKKDTQFLKIVKLIRCEIGSKESMLKSFRVKRTNVNEALLWLKKYNYMYEHIEITPENLNCIEGSEGDLSSVLHEELVRYEFAPGRGQIHAHMLCITSENDIQKLCYPELQKKNGNQLRAKTMAEWAQKQFGLTALATECTNMQDKDEHPCSRRYSESNGANDANELMTMCQMHHCSGFCVKTSTDKKEYVHASFRIVLIVSFSVLF